MKLLFHLLQQVNSNFSSCSPTVTWKDTQNWDVCKILSTTDKCGYSLIQWGSPWRLIFLIFRGIFLKIVCRANIFTTVSTRVRKHGYSPPPSVKKTTSILIQEPLPHQHKLVLNGLTYIVYKSILINKVEMIVFNWNILHSSVFWYILWHASYTAWIYSIMERLFPASCCIPDALTRSEESCDGSIAYTWSATCVAV